LTGSVEVEQAKKTISDRRLSHVITKCTAFAPKDRYKNAAEVRDALTGRSTRRRVLAFVCTALIVLTTAFCLFNFTRPQNQPPIGVTFQEPLIEEAVRLTLDKNETESIPAQDLL
jgi:hypothetical protein